MGACVSRIGSDILKDHREDGVHQDDEKDAADHRGGGGLAYTVGAPARLETPQAADARNDEGKREALGDAGEDGILKFELRKGREPLDPIKWIKFDSF